jgi:protein gp37
MGDKTGIEWTDATWNPVTGCTKVSPGCDHCYADTFAERWRGTPGHYYENGFDVELRPDKLELPLRWTKPRRIFVNSMSDLFHDAIPEDYICQVFGVMARSRRHTFQILTKRHGRMRSLLKSGAFWAGVSHHAGRYLVTAPPLPNVWLGVSAEDQQRADLRIPALLDTPAAVRWVSAEPLLGPIDLDNCSGYQAVTDEPDPTLTYLDWVVVGGESGHGARPMHPQWARSLRDQCQQAGVPFLFKQRGEWSWNEPGQFQLPAKPYTARVAVMHPAGMVAMTKGNDFDPLTVGHDFWCTRIERVGKKLAGRELDGRTWDQYPDA